MSSRANAWQIRVNRKLRSTDVIDALSDLFILRGIPGHIRSDNGPEFVAMAVRELIAAVGAKTAYIERDSPSWGRAIPPPMEVNARPSHTL
jgi:hypothetical protein